MNDGWSQVTRNEPCPICEKPDWCSWAADRTAVCCARITSDKKLGSAGWLHRLRDGNTWHRHDFRPIEIAKTKRTQIDFSELTSRYERAATVPRIAQLARQLGVSFDSLRRLHVGWCGRSWTFPMLNNSGTVTGIRLRYPNGRKLAVRGSRDGLFIPDGLHDTGQFFVAEGPSDCAALISIGLHAIGRPSCRGAISITRDTCKNRDIVIVADGDAPGQQGATQLARVLRPVCSSVEIILPPPGVKDAREWIQTGATRGDIELTINNGTTVRFGEHIDRAVGDNYYEAG